MKAFYHILDLVIVVFGIAHAVQGDMETYRFGIIIGMLCNIYAEVTD